MTHFQPHRLKKNFNAGPSAVVSMQGRRRKAGQSSRRRAVNATQGRQRNAGPRNAGPSAQCRAAVSSMGWPSTQRRAVVSIQGRRLNRRPFSQCRACQFHAGALAQCSAVSCRCPSVSMQARLFQCRARLFQCRAVSSMQGGLSAQHRNCSKQGVTSMQCRAVCSMQGPSAQRRARLLNAAPLCSTQGRPLNAERSRGRQLKAGPSAQCKAVRFNTGPPAQRRADTSMQGRLVGLTMIF